MSLLLCTVTLLVIRFNLTCSFTIVLPKVRSNKIFLSSTSSSCSPITSNNNNNQSKQKQLRRSFLTNTILSTLIVNNNIFGVNLASAAQEESTVTTTSSSIVSSPSLTNEAVITDKIYITFKGVVNDPSSTDTQRIVIGLFGKNAPRCTSILKLLVSKNIGYQTPCKPRPTRVLEREQLESNKVYNNCISNEQNYGTTYEGSTVWRVQNNQRIDVGAIVGKFLARENPYFEEDSATTNNLLHDTPGIISVRKGNEGGFGFTIHYYDDNDDLSKDTLAAQEILDQDNIVIGRIIEGMDVVDKLNNIPIVKSANLNYMGLTGGPTVTTQATRACRYGGPMYCNEFKPLRKVQILDCGLM